MPVTTEAVTRSPGWSRPVIVIKKKVTWTKMVANWVTTLYCCASTSSTFRKTLLWECQRSLYRLTAIGGLQIHMSDSCFGRLTLNEETPVCHFWRKAVGVAGPKPSRSQWHHAIWQMGKVQPVANGIPGKTETCI